MNTQTPRPPRASLSERVAAIAKLGLFSGGALRHILQKLGLMTFGAVYVSDTGRRLRMAFDTPRAPSSLRTALVAHVYYPELMGEILRCRSFMPEGTPLFATVPQEKADAVKAMIADAPAVTLIEVPNRGRDIAPFLTVLSSGELDAFDAVLKIHTKRSPHLLDGEVRRKMLYDKLCGSRGGVSSVLRQFADPATGMVGWRSSFRMAAPYWMGNRPRVESLARRMGVAEVRLGFFEGSMFWFRPAALASLRQLALKTDCFEIEAGQVDGTLHHAVERLFTIATWAAGQEVRALDGGTLVGSAPEKPLI